MTMLKLIVNPVAGAGTGARAIPQVERLLQARGLPYNLVTTQYRGHATQLATEAVREGFDVVVACGGDGTSNEVINGLKAAPGRSKLPALGILCAGRGNDLAHAVGVPASLEAGVATLAAGRRRSVDLGRVSGGMHPEGRYFGSCVGVGFDAVSTIEAAKLPRWGGFASFLIAILRTIFLFPHGPTVRLEYDGQTLITPTLMVSVMNGRRLGGGFWMAPDAEPDDGVFDICVARQVSRRRILTLIPHFLRGTQGTQPEIKMLRARRIAIQAVAGVLPAQSDGEIISTDSDRLEIDVLPRALEVVSA